MFPKSVYREVLNRLEEYDKKELERVKREVAREYGLKGFPRNYDLIKAATESEREKLNLRIRIKPTRLLAGVKVVSVVTKPFPCGSHCIYCPHPPDAPPSYNRLEPAIQRAVYNGYDPYKQVRNRLEQYELMGYPEADKIEVRIISGTFLALAQEYKREFVKGVYDGLNGKVANSLEEAKKLNEKAKYRCVSLNIETRPDYCFEPHVDEMLGYGVTKVEIGVQTIHPEILQSINRGHGVGDVIKANQVTRDAGLKIGFHLMPNLPSSTPEKDLEMFKRIFSDPRFRPDYLKIYPTLTMKGTRLYELWTKGKYEPYEFEELVDLLAKAKRYIPKYCRIQRLGRDVPSDQIVVGCKKTNLREYVQKRAKELGIECRCIRCRELGFRARDGIHPDLAHVKLCRLDYDACKGKEIFLSYEDSKNGILIGFLRLRVPNQSHRPEININNKTVVVRELKVAGPSVPIENLPRENQWQHKGFGKKLMREAESIARELNKEKIVVTSAVGAREYYSKLGYERDGSYMSKIL